MLHTPLASMPSPSKVASARRAMVGAVATATKMKSAPTPQVADKTKYTAKATTKPSINVLVKKTTTRTKPKNCVDAAVETAEEAELAVETAVFAEKGETATSKRRALAPINYKEEDDDDDDSMLDENRTKKKKAVTSKKKKPNTTENAAASMTTTNSNSTTTTTTTMTTMVTESSHKLNGVQGSDSIYDNSGLPGLFSAVYALHDFRDSGVYNKLLGIAQDHMYKLCLSKEGEAMFIFMMMHTNHCQGTSTNRNFKKREEDIVGQLKIPRFKWYDTVQAVNAGKVLNKLWFTEKGQKKTRGYITKSKELRGLGKEFVHAVVRFYKA